MAEHAQAVVAGDSHLAREICALLMKRGIRFARILPENVASARERLRDLLPGVRALFAVTDDDRVNNWRWPPLISRKIYASCSHCSVWISESGSSGGSRAAVH